MASDLRSRFESGYIPEPNSGCWIWTRSGIKQGYGLIRDGNGKKLAHRVAYKLFVCDPGEVNVLHKCDNPACVNPDHLWLGTQQENALDCVKKKRHHNLKLSDKQVMDMRTRRISQKAFAELYGVHWMTVHKVQTGKLRGWLNDQV